MAIGTVYRQIGTHPLLKRLVGFVWPEMAGQHGGGLSVVCEIAVALHEVDLVAVETVDHVGKVELASVKAKRIASLRAMTTAALRTTRYPPLLGVGRAVDDNIHWHVCTGVGHQRGIGAGGVPSVANTIHTAFIFYQQPGFDSFFG